MSGESRPVKSRGIHCDECDAYIPNEASLAAHLKGKKHIKNVERINNWRAMAERSLYIAGIGSCHATELQLADHFSQFGQIAKITVDKNKGHFAILEFCEKDAAEKALCKHQHYLGSCRIIVKKREVKVPIAKKDSNHDRNHLIHSQMAPEIWSAVMEANTTDDQFCIVQTQLSLHAEDIHMRELLCELLRSAFIEVFPACKVQPFGSSVNGFGVHGCDLDLNFHYDDVNYDAALQFLAEENEMFPEAMGDNMDGKILNVKQVLTVVSAIIKQCIPDCHKVKAILSARRPVVKFHHRVSQMCCDISVGNALAVRNTMYLKHLCSSIPYLSPLIQTVRLWMKHWNLAGSVLSGTPLVNNYAVTLLVLFYLHNSKPKELEVLDEMRRSDAQLQPCMIECWDCSFSDASPQLLVKNQESSLSELLFGFFRYYSKLDFAKFVLCLKTGQLQDVSSLKLSTSKEHLVKTDRNAKFFKYGALNIRDPFELNHNVAGNVGQKLMHTFTKCIRNAALACEMKLYSKKNAHKKEPWGILNLFVDHHRKKASDQVMKKNYSNESVSYVIKLHNKSLPRPNWCEAITSLVVTVLKEVFLMTINTSNIANAELSCNNEAAGESICQYTSLNFRRQSVSTGDVLNGNETSPESRKRRQSNSPIYCKRARLALNSPEASHLKIKAGIEQQGHVIEFPFFLRCNAVYKVWEGRRKVRRQLVQPGKADLLDLERQVSELIVSERTVESPQSLHESKSCEVGTVDTSAASCSSKESIQTHFDFDVTVTKSASDSLMLTFEHQVTDYKSEQDFQNFFHHLETFLPNIVAKCDRLP